MNQIFNADQNSQPPMTATPESVTPAKAKEGWGDIIKFMLLTVLIVVPIRLYIAQPFIVSGTSMYPTFDDHQYLIVDELSYLLRAPARGEVVVFRFPGDPSKYYIKRIIALPGETVTIKNGKVAVIMADGAVVPDQDPYIIQKTISPTVPKKLGSDEYFVMGDNRAVSYDSRYWGPLPRNLMRGRALLRLWPFTRVAYLPGNYVVPN